MSKTAAYWHDYIRDRARREGYRLWLATSELLRWCECNTTPASDGDSVWSALLEDTPWAHKEGEFDVEESEARR